MNKETKETAVRLVPREYIQFFKDDEGFVRHIAHGLSTALAERILSILISEGEIIVRQSDLRAEEQKMLNQVEYRQNIMWTPLVRCKDCLWWKTNYTWNGTEHKVCVIEPYEPCRNPNDYCSRGERKDGADE